MKDQLKTLITGVAGQLAYNDVFKISDSEKSEMLNPDNWTYTGCNSAVIMLNEMRYLFEYTKFFIQIQFTVKNNVVVRIDTITKEKDKVSFDDKT